MKNRREWALIALLALGAASYVHADAHSPTLATINGEAVTRQDLWQYAKGNPAFTAELATPGGPMRVLRNLVSERLFVLEGERRGISRPDRGGQAAFAHKVMSVVLPACPEPNDDEVRAYYDANALVFATPFYLRVERVALRYAPETEDEVVARLSEIRERIVSGELSFADAVARYSEDPFGKQRGGDLGFMPEDPRNPFPRALAVLRDAKPGFVTETVKERDFIAIYRATDRREPIFARFEDIKHDVRRDMRNECRRVNVARTLEELRSRWPVQYMKEDIEPWGMMSIAQ